MKINKYGISEPDETNAAIEIATIDCVVTPLLGYNSKKYRLGYGSGFYDRTFEYKLQTPNAKPYLLGIAYDFQLITWQVHE